MPFGTGLPKTSTVHVDPFTGLKCHTEIHLAPAGNPAYQMIPDSADQINSLAVGAAYTSTATDGVWVALADSAGHWTVTGPP